MGISEIITKELAGPIYQDLLQPSAKEIGQTTAHVIKLLLRPINGICKMSDNVITKLFSLLKNIPPEDLSTPPLNIVGPIFEAVKYSAEEPLLFDLYAQVLASSMNKNTKNGILPAFVEIIKQLTSDEARLIKLFVQDKEFPLLTVRWQYKNPTPELNGGEDIVVNFSHLGKEAFLECPEMTSIYLDNLSRLKLIEIPSGYFYSSPKIYNFLENDPIILKEKEQIEQNPNLHCVLIKKGVFLTEFGKHFIKKCVHP